MADQAVKTWEDRLRRMAQRQGCTLHKSRMRDPRGLLYGRWWLLDMSGGPMHGTVHGAPVNGIVGDPPGLALDEVERILNGEQP